MKLRVAMFYHSLVSDWNHGNAHFLRGVASDVKARGHEVRIYEPADGWSRQNLVGDHGPEAICKFERAFPHLRSTPYRLGPDFIDRELEDVDLALVHEWNDAELVSAVGRHRRRNRHIRVLFHDTHHRAVTAPYELRRFNLAEYDGVLAYGASLKHAYERLGWGRQVHVWHEAADVRTFYPRKAETKTGDVVWIGNWGDEERTNELREFFIHPANSARLKAEVYGVRYPDSAIHELASASIAHRGWLPNFEVPHVFARFRATVHIPRRPYTRQLPGIPTIRPFEALACGIPLVSAPWDDTEGLFRIGEDFLMACNGSEMQHHLQAVVNDHGLAESLAENGLETIRTRHTCAHRVDELFKIYSDMKAVTQNDSTPVSVEAQA
ncbi:MAG: glycosyltransferase [Acidobacteriaceae bacterium]|nr:glycosyltransferase [Acidobacteriaceae bacterium]